MQLALLGPSALLGEQDEGHLEGRARRGGNAVLRRDKRGVQRGKGGWGIRCGIQRAHAAAPSSGAASAERKDSA